jgi:2-alkyl-3-oxoalkanoate reductase
MRIMDAGATGALGRQLLPISADAGHVVFGMTRSPDKIGRVKAAGAVPLVADALDAASVLSAMRQAMPEGGRARAHRDPAPLQYPKVRSRIRSHESVAREGTDHLLNAARAIGVRRFIAQSFAGWHYARERDPVKNEEDPLDPDPPPALTPTLAALHYLEAKVTGAEAMEGIALR